MDELESVSHSHNQDGNSENLVRIFYLYSAQSVILLPSPKAHGVGVVHK